MDYDSSQNQLYQQQDYYQQQQQQQQQQQDYLQQQQQQQDYQQQLQDYQQQYQQQQQHQQLLQQQSSQTYDPSQAQSYGYDPSTQAYYPTYPQTYQTPTNTTTSESFPQHQQYLQQDPQYASYYPPDYGVPGVYQQPIQADPNSAQLQTPNVGVPQEAPQIADSFAPAPAGQPQQNAYYPPEQQPQQHPAGYDVPQGLNPAAAAAVAALSQLTQFAGKMDAAERAMAEQRQWQAGNQGFGQMVHPQPNMHLHPYPYPHPPGNFGPPVGRPPYRGGGRRGGGRFRGGRSNFGHHQPRPDGGAPNFRGRGRIGRDGGRRFPHTSPAYVSSPHLESAPSQAPDRRHRAPKVAWCDICRVDCNTQEVLEEHMSGKRHKKNMEKFEKFQKYEKRQSKPQPKPAEQLENGQGGEDNKVFAPESLPDASAAEYLSDAPAPDNLPKASSVENLPSATAVDENKMEAEQQLQVVEQSELPKVDEPTEASARKPWARRFDDQRHAPKWKSMKFGRGGKRPRYSEVISSSQTPKEEPKYCALCNVTCDTRAVFECHLSGKKHMIRVKQTGGQHGSQPHDCQTASNLQVDNQPSNGQAQQAVMEPQAQLDLGLQEKNSTAEPEVADAVVVGNGDPGAAVVEFEGKGTALENASMGAMPDFITVQDVSASDFGVSSSNVMPGLDVKVDEGSKSSE